MNGSARKVLLSTSVLLLVLMGAEAQDSHYEPANEVDVLSVKYSWEAGHRNLRSRSYLVEGDALRIERHEIGFMEPGGDYEGCVQLTKEEGNSIEKLARQIIRARWYDIKRYEDLQGAIEEYYNRSESVEIEYAWNDKTEKVNARFSTLPAPYGTVTYKTPELLVIQKLLVQIQSSRYRRCIHD